MRYANPTRGRFAFRREHLPNAAEYYREQGLKLFGGGEWKSAVCPFHDDTRPSLRVQLDTGGFRCMACGTHGSDVLAFHMQRHGLPFIDAAKALGAWEGGR
jgi:CHC2 zinc finger